jgi:hypothetical protein
VSVEDAAVGALSAIHELVLEAWRDAFFSEENGRLSQSAMALMPGTSEQTISVWGRVEDRRLSYGRKK